MRDTPPPSDSKYRTISPLGHGGLTEVFLTAPAAALEPARLAVLKYVWPELAQDTDLLPKILADAQPPLQMCHPNLVSTYEVGLANGRPFIATEYVAGQSLTQVLRRLRGDSALALSFRLDIVIDVLSALGYVHDHVDDRLGRGDVAAASAPVHRNVSPNNVLVGYDGVVKLADFGIAKSALPVDPKRAAGSASWFGYSAPEQLQGQIGDRRTDLFSVGLILWELLAGQPLLSGRPDRDITALLAGDLPLPELGADLGIPTRLREIALRAVALDPQARYQGAGAFARDLRCVLADLDSYPAELLGEVVTRAFNREKRELDREIAHFLGTGAKIIVDPGISADSDDDDAAVVDDAAVLTVERLPGRASRTGVAIVPPPPPLGQRVGAPGWWPPRRRHLGIAGAVVSSGLLAVLALWVSRRDSDRPGARGDGWINQPSVSVARVAGSQTPNPEPAPPPPAPVPGPIIEPITSVPKTTVSEIPPMPTPATVANQPATTQQTTSATDTTGEETTVRSLGPRARASAARPPALRALRDEAAREALREVSRTRRPGARRIDTDNPYGP